jgi:YggT family protein
LTLIKATQASRNLLISVKLTSRRNPLSKFSKEALQLMSAATGLLITSLARFLQIYTFLIIVRILLTWFPTVTWMNQVEAFLSPITDPYLNVFRSFIPPLGGLDFSPILAILVLNVVAELLGSLAFGSVPQY